MEALEPDDYEDRFIELAGDRIFSTPLSPAVAELGGSKRPLAKAAVALKGVFPPRDVMARQYRVASDSLRVYAYYPVRMMDVLMRHGRHVWQLLRGDEDLRALARRENEFAALRSWLMSP